MYEIFIFIVLLFVFLYLKNAIDRLRDEVDYLHAKLEIRKKETSVAAGQSVPLEKMQAAVETIPLEIVQEPPAAALEQKPAATIEAFGIGPEKKSDGNLEFKIGSKIFTSVGVVAVICAVGFFLRYAFENGLINEFGRVVLGVAAGIILLIIGEITRKHYLSYSHALTGGGLGVLYVSFYAGFAFYRLMAQPAAFFAMVLITAVGILLSLRQNSMALAIFAQIGGFLTPLLIGNGNSSPHILFLYVALLDVAVFLTAFYKLWQPLSAVSFAGTALAYFYWYFNFYSSFQFASAQGYLTLFFAIFLFISFIQYFIKKSPENSWDLALISLNPMFYFVMSYAIINPLYPDSMGWFTIILGAFYCVLAVMVGGEGERASLFRHFLLTPGFILLAIAAPIQFDGKWVVVAWAAEALAFAATGFKLKLVLYRALGNLLIFISLFRLVFFENTASEQAIFLLNGRFLSYVMCFAAAAGAAYLYRQFKREISEGESAVFPLLLLESALAIVVGTSFEIHDFFANHGKWSVMVWAAEALAFIAIGYKLKLVLYRAFGHCLFLIALFRLVVFEGDLAAAAAPIFNLRLLAYIIFFAMVVGAAYLYRRKKSELGNDGKSLFPVLALEAAFAGLFGMSLEIYDFFGSYWYPVLWTMGGLAAGLLSFRFKSTTLRCVTYMTFAAAFFHLLVFDSHVQIAGYLPLFNARVFAFVASAVAIRFFLALIRANKGKISIGEYQFFQPLLFMVFHFLALWITSAEIISYCDKQELYPAKFFAGYDFENIKNVLLSAAWTVYGVMLMAAGIIKKTTHERFLAIALFAVVIVKVFLVDTAELSDIYRFFSFIILGFFLLLAGYLYYRYRDRIAQFAQDNKNQCLGPKK